MRRLPHGGRISADIRNFYTLCGQAQKSMAVKHGGLPRLYLDLKRRHETWSKQGASRFLKGDMKLLSYFKEKARRAKVDFEVVLVQPGASAETVTPEILRLLATTELFLTKTTQARFRVLVSRAQAGFWRRRNVKPTELKLGTASLRSVGISQEP